MSARVALSVLPPNVCFIFMFSLTARNSAKVVAIKLRLFANQLFKRAADIVQRAIKNGLTEVEVFRFPNTLCTDNGGAISNAMKPGWENILTGLPEEIYFSWNRHLRPIGYKIRVRFVDFSGDCRATSPFIKRLDNQWRFDLRRFLAHATQAASNPSASTGGG